MNYFRVVLCRGLRCGVLIAVLRTSLPAQQNGVASTTALSASTPSLVLPAALTLTATVNQASPTSFVPTGSVAFSYDKGIALGSSPLQAIPSSQKFPATPTASIDSMGTQPVALAAFDLFGTGAPVLVAANQSNNNASVAATVRVFPNLGAGTFGGPGTLTGLIPTAFPGLIDQIAGGFFLSQTRKSLLVHQQNSYYLFDGTSTSGVLAIGTRSAAGLTGLPELELDAIDDFDGDGFSDVGVLILAGHDANNGYHPPNAGIALNQGANAPGSFVAFAPAVLPTTSPDGTAGSFCVDGITTGKFDASLQAQLAVLGHFGTCSQATPPNTPSYLALYTAPPTASPVSGFFTPGTVPVTISSVLPDATIYYTTDGSTPSTQSSVYSGPIPVNLVTASVTVNAIAVSSSGVETVVGSSTYFPLIIEVNSGGGNRVSTSAKSPLPVGALANRTARQVLPRLSNTLALHTVGVDQTSIAAADFNHDGNLDLLIGSSTDKQVQMFSGNGAGAFQAVAATPTPAGPLLLTVSDFNGDGYPDVAMTLNGAGGLAVTLNDGKGNLLTPTQPYSPGSPIALTSAAFDSGGLGDLALLEPSPAQASPTNVDGAVQTLLSTVSAQTVFTTLPQTLPAGNHTLSAAYIGDSIFAPSASSTISEVVTQTTPTIAWSFPDPISYSTPPPTLGSQLDAKAMAAGAVLPGDGTYTYTPAAGAALSLGANTLQVVFTPADAFDYTSATATATQQVNLPPASATVSVDSANTSGGQQPSINLTFASFPVDVAVTITLAFTDGSAVPAASNGSIGFVNLPSTDTLSAPNVDTFMVSAGSTAAQPQRFFNVGTVEGSITVTIAIQYNQTNITPSSLVPVPLQIPASVPTLDTATYSVNGSTLTVVMTASSTTREISAAAFHFTPVAGKSLATTDLNLQSPSEFPQWFTGAASAKAGGGFTYTQTFSLSSDADVVGGVTVTLQNGQGISVPLEAQKSD